MTSTKVFNNIDLKEYIFSFIYSFNYIIKYDKISCVHFSCHL